MQQRTRRLVLRHVVACERGEAPIRNEERGEACIARDRREVDTRWREGGDEEDRSEGQRRGREKPANAPGVEVRKRDAAGRIELAQQRAGDDESGDHEENVDSDVPARNPARDRMKGYNEENGDRAQALDVGPD